MKNIYIILVTLFLCSASNAQKLENCSLCSLSKYSDADIIDNKLFEIILLRNEIFARHNYSFKNQRLEEYYSKYDWYNPDYKNPIKKVNLNSIEQNNIDVFKVAEEKIKKNRSLLINELGKLKFAIKQNDKDFIGAVFKELIEINDDTLYSTLVSAIDDVLSSIDMKNINWHKGKAQYEIEVDDGFSVSTKGIYIKGNSITIMVTDPMKHSSLMHNDDAFEYPSDYYSESENTSGAELEFKNGGLILKKTIFAG